MQEIFYEFVDLDSDESFIQFGRSLGGVLENQVLCFDNQIAKGELTKISPEQGLWIRKWKFTVLQKITLHKTPPVHSSEKKICSYLFFKSFNFPA